MHTRSTWSAALLLSLPLTCWAVDPPAPPAASAPPAAATAPNQPAADLEQARQRLEEAQARLEEAAREVAELSMTTQINLQNGTVSISHETRPVLGVQYNAPKTPGEFGTDRGATVVNVRPGSPADAAGLRVNDLIIAINGQPLGFENGDSPAAGMQRMTRALKVGTPVRIQYQRDGATHQAQVTPIAAPQNRMGISADRIEVIAPPLPPIPPTPAVSSYTQRRVCVYSDPAPSGTYSTTRTGTCLNLPDANGFGSTELAELSPGLGRYFGASKGLLVVRAPRDQRLKLEDGDVISDIDGRVPSGVGNAFEILNSYHPGDSMTFHIVREQKRMDLHVDLPLQSQAPVGRFEPVVEPSPG